MSALGALLAGIKRIANAGILLSVADPPSIVLNLLSGLQAVNNPVTGFVDLSVVGGVGGGIIWRPGGVKSGGVVTLASDVAAAIVANPQITVYVDSSLAAAQVPSGVTMNCQMATTWASYQAILSADAGNNVDIVTFLDGSVLSRPKQVLNGLTVYLDSKTTQGLVFQNNDNFTLNGASILMTSTATNIGCVIAGTLAFYASNIAIVGQPGTRALFSIPVGQTLDFYATVGTGSVDPDVAIVSGTMNYIHDLSSPYVQMTTVTGTENDILLGNGGNRAYYNSGADGAHVADGVAALPGATLVGSTYTLTRTVSFTTLTVNPGVTIKTAGYAIFCSVRRINNGNIDASGATGAAGGGGAAFGAYGGGGNGGASATAGQAFGNNVVSQGGLGGTGGNGTGSNGGAGGTQNGPTVMQALSLATLLGGSLTLTTGADTTPTTVVFAGGSGGGGGGANGVGGQGGVGGGAGGYVLLAAATKSGSGTVTANGGAGQAGTASNAGGGAGGGGGVIVDIYGTNEGTETLAAAGGLGGASGGGAGVAGAAGAAGTVLTVLG